MEESMNTSALASVNDKLLGGASSFPTVTLPTGETIRTGTIAALRHNIKLYDAAAIPEEKAKLGEEIGLALPVLKRVGMFELFGVEEWTSGKSEGKKLVGRLAKDAGY